MQERFEFILDKALKMKSRDIHFSIIDEKIDIRCRCIDGLKKIPSTNQDIKLFNYLQYQAHLDVSNLANSDCGSFSYFYKNTTYNFRFSVSVSLKMKNGVLRILNCHNGYKLDQLTFQEDVKEYFLRLINLKSGLVIFSGNTGSGKTTTMYSLLKLAKDKKIYTIEDPIEVYFDDFVQTEVNESIGYDYYSGIKQIMRQNPDIIMIGEIRDEKAAKGAIRAALTGCLVFCSIHSKDCQMCINRLLDLQINSSDLAICIDTIVSQKLVKKKGKNEYICVYEIMDHSNVLKAIEHKKTNHKKLEDIIERAIKDEKIEEI